MPHRSRLFKVSIDVPAETHDAELAFWAGAVGRDMRQARFPDFHLAPLAGQEFTLITQRIYDGPPGVHVDFHTDDLEAEVTRLEALGARRERLVEGEWWIMRDPAGLPFCVLEEPPGVLVEGNSTLWE